MQWKHGVLTTRPSEKSLDIPLSSLELIYEILFLLLKENFPAKARISCFMCKGFTLLYFVNFMSILLNSLRLSTWMWHTANSLSLALTVTVIQFWHVSSRLCVCVCVFNIYLFMAALGLPCCVLTFSSCGEWGYSQVVALGLLVVLTSLVWIRLCSPGSVVVVHGLCCPSSCGIFPDQGLNTCPLHWQVDS